MPKTPLKTFLFLVVNPDGTTESVIEEDGTVMKAMTFDNQNYLVKFMKKLTSNQNTNNKDAKLQQHMSQIYDNTGKLTYQVKTQENIPGTNKKVPGSAYIDALVDSTNGNIVIPYNKIAGGGTRRRRRRTLRKGRSSRRRRHRTARRRI
jgi:hypothetical protein